MASTPSHCSVAASKSYQNRQYPHNNLQGHRKTYTHHQRNQHHQRLTARQKFSLAPPPVPAIPTSSAPATTVSPTFSSLSPLQASKSDFSGHRSTRFVSKFHLGRPKATASRHSPAAEEALQLALQCDRNVLTLQKMLDSSVPRLSGFDDYSFVLRELGARKEYLKAVGCFKFWVDRERKPIEQGKLATATISMLGRNGRYDMARSVFEEALNAGYGNSVFAFSALISAYGKSRDPDEAIKVFNSMKEHGLKPNLVVYNALIDALGKAGVNFSQVVVIFDQMLENGVQPDRITFNSLLAVCSKGGLWEAARSLFTEMEKRGILQDIFTYNTLLDAICKGGQMDLAFEIMCEMPVKHILPNVVTYSTMIDGYAKAGRLDEALSFFDEMKILGIGLDRVSYNTVLSIYAKLGRFEEAIDICKEMEGNGIQKDVVTYNALLGGYGKQFKYNDMRRIFEEMKMRRLSPNLLTYSTLIDVYSKGGLYKEAMDVFSEFKRAGLKADVVLYSALIDSLCKNGLVESAVSLLDEMTKEGILPNVVTYNSIIDAFGRSTILDGASNKGSVEKHGTNVYSLPSHALESSAKKDLVKEGNQVIKVFEQLVADKALLEKVGGKREILCILGVFHKMHELKIKPNVVTFSAILNACSRCDSFSDASVLLEELRLFDNKVYGVAYGLLMGYRESIWMQALSLFDEVKLMDLSTASAFYNALTDMLWHFSQKQGAQRVVLEGKRRQVWENVWSDSCLDLHLMSSGAACAMVHAWLLNIRSSLFEGHELPKLLSILTGWGKHSKVVGDSALRRNVEALLSEMGSPFRLAKCNMGRFISSGSGVAAWLRDTATLNLLLLYDARSHQPNVKIDTLSNPLMVPL